MKKLFAFALFALAFVVGQAQTVTQFATFTNNDAPYPENITRDIFGNLYLPLTFGQAVNKVSPSGVVTKYADIPDVYLLGVTFDPFGNLTVVSAAGRIWKVTPWGHVYLFSTVTTTGTINDLVHDYQGNLYIGDDTNEVILKVDICGNVTTWATSTLFNVPNSYYPFPEGVNGLALSLNGRTIYVTNTSEGRVIAVDINNDGTAAPARLIVEDTTLVGIDGLKVAWNGDLYIAQNTNFTDGVNSNPLYSNRILKVKQDGTVSVVASGGVLNFPTGLVLNQLTRTIFVANNGDAFFGVAPANQGVVKIQGY
jgi:sugar lactone lactonase YvrE